MGLLQGTGIDAKFREDWGYPQCRIEDGTITSWHADNARQRPTDAEIKTWRDNQDVYTSNEDVKSERRRNYPNIGDQLDDLYKAGAFSADMTAQIKKVKDDNPKA